MDAHTADPNLFGKGFYLRYLHFPGGDCGLIFPLLVKFHCVPDGSPYCPVFPPHVFTLAQPSMVRLSLDENNFKVFAQYQCWCFRITYKNPRSWLQNQTRRSLNFWCKSASLGCLEILGVPPSLIDSLERLAQKTPVFMVYQRKGPWVRVGPDSLPCLGGQLFGKRSASQILSSWYILK